MPLASPTPFRAALARTAVARTAVARTALAMTLVALLTGCRTAPRKEDPAAKEAASAAGSNGKSTEILPTDPRVARFQRADLLISQWDAGQAEGRGEQADQVFQQVRSEVDGSYADFVSASRGSEGVRLQYLGVAALGFSANPGATQVLVERLTDNDGHLVGNALIALKLRADPATPLGPVMRLIAAGAAEPKRYAPLALANVLEARQKAGMPRNAGEERSALHLLSGVVADRDPFVRLHVAKALGVIQEPGAYDLLLVLVKDEHIRIRVAAAAALERLGDPRGFGEVVGLLADAPEESKPVLRDVLASYAERLMHRPLDPAEVDHLGTSAMAWNHWWAEYQGQRGISVTAATPPGPGPAPVRVQAPASFPPPASVPQPLPRPVSPPTRVPVSAFPSPQPISPPPSPAPASGASSSVPAPPPPPRIR